MSILSRVLPKPGIAVDKILNEFTKKEIEDIYPSLSQILVQALVEELELMGYLEVKDGKAKVTDKGAKKLESFKASLTAEEKEALKM
jgi:ribosomal protein S19E (S16A)